MILYTVMPLEAIFQEDEGGGYQDLIIEGVQLEVEQTTPGRGRITRIISTNPQDYLDPRWQPGTEVPL